MTDPFAINIYVFLHYIYIHTPPNYSYDSPNPTIYALQGSEVVAISSLPLRDRYSINIKIYSINKVNFHIKVVNKDQILTLRALEEMDLLR